MNRNRIKHLMRQAEQLQQARRPAAPPKPTIDRFPQFRDPQFIAEVIGILAEIGALTEEHCPDALRVLDEVHADALRVAAFGITQEERDVARARLADIERLLPGRHSLEPEDLRMAEEYVKAAHLSRRTDDDMPVSPEDRP